MIIQELIKNLLHQCRGYYEIETWGAQGGSGRSEGGKGGYSKGTIFLQENEKIYIYVGQKRDDNVAAYNAGSTGGSSLETGQPYNGRAGGGATDVRLEKTATTTVWNETMSLRSRIMVAGGRRRFNQLYNICTRRLCRWTCWRSRS